MKFYKEIEKESFKAQKKIKARYGRTYINVPMSFDIESTSTYYQGEKCAFMYIWQFCMIDENYIYYGRTWEEFLDFLHKLRIKLKVKRHEIIVIYVHNLSFEFQFLNQYFTWEKVFAVDNRKPIKALCKEGFEFRDSLILSAMSLAKTADNLLNHSIKKLVGDLDYSLIRTKDTELTDLEMEYCANDVIIVVYYITEQMEKYGNIVNIPLTNTSRVRKFIKEKCFHTNKNHKKDSPSKYRRFRSMIKSLTIEKDEYELLKQAFAGGYTHANVNYVGNVEKNVASVDFTSSYPAVMLSELFPMSKGVKVNIETIEQLEEFCKNYCCVFVIEYVNIKSKINQDNYISVSKCIEIENQIENNGRVFSADRLKICITNVDYNIIKQVYSYTRIGIGEFYYYKKGYLPKNFIGAIMELYKNKTELKGIKGKEYEYLVSKGMLNSCYGMCVTAIIRDENNFETQWEKIPANVDEQLQSYNNKEGRFLFYPWGIFVTAYARKNLWEGILNVGDDYIYSDTDSIKLKNYDRHKDYFDYYNQKIIWKLENMCNEFGFDTSSIKPKNQKGIEKPLGVWDFEGTYKLFKTLGAKRYLTFKDDLEITCAGVPKKNAVNYLKEISKDTLDCFDNFNTSLTIPKDKSGKMTHTYIDDFQDLIIEDYQGHKTEIHCKGGVHLENVEFTLSISRQYETFILEVLEGLHYIGDYYNG